MSKMTEFFYSNLTLYEPDQSTKIGVRTLRINIKLPNVIINKDYETIPFKNFSSTLL